MMKILRKIKTLFNIIKYHILEKEFKTEAGSIKYLFFPKRSSDLLICFQAFPPRENPVYYNVKGFKNLQVDRLYIADTFGYRASYYLFENGKNTPYLLTCELIEFFLKKGNYKRVFTAGTSKGGTSAIFYGLKYNASDIFAGACQYNLGSYLSVPVHLPILKSMMGKTSNDVVDLLNSIIPNHLEQNKSKKTLIHLVYSTKEHTYEEHTKDLLKKNKRMQHEFC